MKRLLPLLAFFVAKSFADGVSLEGFVGSSSPIGHWNHRAAWSVGALYRIDQMVAAGVAVGYDAIPTRPVGSATSRLQVRLPFGRQVLPYLQCEAGAGIRPVLEDSYFLWKLGGGFDLKLGDRSSLLVESGWQTWGRYYGRLGLLLEL